MVILPDYQGIGLGTKFLNSIAKKYTNEGFDFRLITSAKNLIYALNKNENWILQKYEKNKIITSKTGMKLLNNTIRKNVKTGTFLFAKRK